MEKAYRQYEELAETVRKSFDEIVNIQKELVAKEKEMYLLNLEKKRVAQQLITYLHRTHYDGIRKDNLIAYLRLFTRGIPSFVQVFRNVYAELCNKDRTKLQNAYTALSNEKEKAEGLVVKL